MCRRLCRVSRTCAEYRGIEQLVARRAHNPEVGGSSPSPATISSGCNGFQLHPLFYYRVRSGFTPAPFLLPQKNHHPRCIPPRTALSDCPTARRKHTQWRRPRGCRRCSSDGTARGQCPDTRRTCTDLCEDEQLFALSCMSKEEIKTLMMQLASSMQRLVNLFDIRRDQEGQLTAKGKEYLLIQHRI